MSSMEVFVFLDEIVFFIWFIILLCIVFNIFYLIEVQGILEVFGKVGVVYKYDFLLFLEYFYKIVEDF